MCDATYGVYPMDTESPMMRIFGCVVDSGTFGPVLQTLRPLEFVPVVPAFGTQVVRYVPFTTHV